VLGVVVVMMMMDGWMDGWMDGNAASCVLYTYM
jgi:hypothetical protein